MAARLHPDPHGQRHASERPAVPRRVAKLDEPRRRADEGERVRVELEGPLLLHLLHPSEGQRPDLVQNVWVDILEGPLVRVPGQVHLRCVDHLPRLTRGHRIASAAEVAAEIAARSAR